MKIDRSKMKYLDKIVYFIQKRLTGLAATVSASPWSNTRGDVGFTFYVRANGVSGENGKWAISVAVVDIHDSWFWVFNQDAVALFETGVKIPFGYEGDYRTENIRFAASETAKRIKEFVVAAAMMK